MSREDFVAQYETPSYVVAAWSAMHANLNSASMLEWEQACARARRECDDAYNAKYGG